ncbi:MAG: hypothetical protein AAF984_10310 [Verrucomicrobiota bacterium]
MHRKLLPVYDLLGLCYLHANPIGRLVGCFFVWYLILWMAYPSLESLIVGGSRLAYCHLHPQCTMSNVSITASKIQSNKKYILEIKIVALCLAITSTVPLPEKDD